MRISSMTIVNFMSIDRMEIKDIDYAFILVGKNGTGKSSVIDAVRLVTGNFKLERKHFRDPDREMQITFTLNMSEDSLYQMNEWGVVSKERSYEKWLAEFKETFPTFSEEDGIKIIYNVTPNLDAKYTDEFGVENKHIVEILPKLYYIDHKRDLRDFQNGLLNIYYGDDISVIKESVCLYDKLRKCDQCF